MEIMRRESLKEFTEFRRLLRAQARAALENTHPKYVQRFAEELKRTEDFEQAASAAQPLLGKGIPKWSQLLTLTLDLELALDKTRRALSLLGKSVPALGPEWNSGAWTVYQLDHWTFEIDAWMERLDRLVKRVCRQLLKPQCPEWKNIEDRLAGDIQVMKNLIGDVRNPLAHGLGGGVTGPEEDLLWEPSLLVDADEDIVSAFYQSLNAARQQKYHQKLRAVTVRSVAVSEALFRELNQYISKSVPKDTDSQPSKP